MPYYRSLFLSDLHLGSPWCQAGELLALLSSVECDRLYLVGDILDGERPTRGRRWPPDHIRVVKMVRDLSRRVEVVYVTGNHDGFLRGEHPLRAMFELSLSRVRLCHEAVHEADDGRRYLVTHGDMYDPALRVPLLGRLGTWCYIHLRSLAEKFPVTWPGLGLASETLEAALMRWQDSLTRWVGDPETRMLDDARGQGLDGVICGHTHLAALRRNREMVYANCGYWTGPAHALVEHPGGALALVPWTESWAPAARPVPAAMPKEARL